MGEPAYTDAQRALAKLISGKCVDLVEYNLHCESLGAACFYGGFQCVVVTREAVEDGICEALPE